MFFHTTHCLAKITRARVTEHSIDFELIDFRIEFITHEHLTDAYIFTSKKCQILQSMVNITDYDCFSQLIVT